MLNFKLEERIKPNEEILVLLQKPDYKVVNGAVKILEGTNVKMIFPVQYIIYKPIQTTILENRVSDINNKPYIIGVPIKDRFKNGMKKQEAKTQVLTKRNFIKNVKK